jgi:hypothetical protein
VFTDTRSSLVFFCIPKKPYILLREGFLVLCKETLLHLFGSLNERDQHTAYEFIQSLALLDGKRIKKTQVEIHGKDYYIVRD